MFDNISVPGAVAIAILVVLVLIVIVRNIYIVQQSKAYVVERLGAFHSVWGVGFHLKVPFIERVVKKVSLKEQVADFDPQPVITKDNVTMQIDTVIYFQITDPKLYTYGVEYPMSAIENLTATTLRNIIGELELDQSLTSRDTINAKMRTILDEATDPWGIKVNRVELKNILPPREIQNAMEKQMKAERERRESILQAEGEKASKILVAEGEKQSAILRADAAKQAKIMAAEAEATSIMKVQQALADAMRMLNENAPNDQVIKLKSLEALEKMADGKATKIIIPSEIQGLAGLAASAKALVENELDIQMERFGYQLQMSGYSMEQYAKMMGGDVSTMRNAFRPAAEKQAKISVTLEKIAEVEGITASDEDIEAEFKSLAEQYELEVDKVKEMVPMDELTGSIKTRKAIKVIVDSAVPVAPKAEEKTEA